MYFLHLMTELEGIEDNTAKIRLVGNLCHIQHRLIATLKSHPKFIASLDVALEELAALEKLHGILINTV